MSPSAFRALAIGVAIFAGSVLSAVAFVVLSAPWGCLGGEGICELIAAGELYVMGGLWTVTSGFVALVVSHKVYRRAIARAESRQGPV